jgi:hypothetical protein
MVRQRVSTLHPTSLSTARAAGACSGSSDCTAGVVQALLLEAGCPRPLLLDGGFTTGEQGAGSGEQLLCRCAMSLEFLIQGLERLGINLWGIGDLPG